MSRNFGHSSRTRQSRVNSQTPREELQVPVAKRTNGLHVSQVGHSDAHFETSHSMIAQLQRTLGNRATARLLVGAADANEPGPATRIQRFPSAVLEQPLKKSDWKKYTKTVKKSGEGVSGGAFFFGSKSGSVKDVVVKAEDGSASNTDTANALLASAGVPVPKARNVSPSETEGQDIIGTAQKRGGYDLNLTGMENFYPTTFLRVMSVASGRSLSSTAKKAGTGAFETLARNTDQFIELLMSGNIRQQLGNMMAADTISGSQDRVMKAGLANIGNIMITDAPVRNNLPRALGPRITAIDSEVTMPVGMTGMTKEALVQLGNDQAVFVDRLIESILYFLNETNPQAGQLFQNHPKYGEMREGLISSLKQAARKQASLGIISGPAPLAPSSNPTSANNQPAQATEGKFEAELRRRRRIVWDALG